MRFVYHLKQLTLITGDIVSFFIGFVISIALRNLAFPTLAQITKDINHFIVVFILWIVVNYIIGLYDLDGRAEKRQIRRFIEAGIAALILGITFFYVSPERKITPKTILILNVLLGFGVSFVWHLLYHRLIGKKALTVNLLIIGTSPEAQEIIDILKHNPEKGYRVVAIVDPEHALKSADLPGLDLYHNLSALRPAITTHKVNMVIVASEFKNEPETLIELYQLLFWPVQVMHLASFYETLTGRIPPSTFSESWFLENLAHKEQPVYDKIRRIFDYLVTIILGVLFVITLPVVALVIKVSSKGPVLYKQKRVGRYGNLFTIYKFRTMYAQASDENADPHAPLFTIKNDERVTSVGTFLRKTRIDELPQVVNLLKGDLTLIGPRPERPEIVQKLEEKMPYYSLRHITKPGITGWAAINQHYTDTLETSLQKLQYDLYYIKNRSFILDLSILLRTVNVVIRLMGQ